MVRNRDSQERFKEISISEFFEKNKHILGFDSPQKSMFMVVKEALDNSLDACEENSILPDISVSIKKDDSEQYTVTVEDNGPGIQRQEIPKVFGQLLYGSRFHRLRQTRGQQGIGITAAILYGQITTGKVSYVKSKIPGDEVAFEFRLGINVKDNTANIVEEKPVIWNKASGTVVSIPLRGKYQVGRQSIFEYLKETAVSNPNMQLSFTDPDNRKFIFSRALEIPSRPSVPVKPYPLGLEMGEVQSMAKESHEKTMWSFLTSDFNRISRNLASEILKLAGIDENKAPGQITLEEISALRDAFTKVKMMPPPTDCLSPLGEEFIIKGLKNVYEEHHPSFYCRPVIRKASVYNGNPFAVEAGLVYGGDLRSDEQVRIVRYANKVPLLYQPGACAITRSISETDWRSYGLEQRQGTGIPFGPAIIFVHVYGVRLPYTSESKEAIANVDAIMEEIKLAMKIIGRSLKSFMNKKDKRQKINEKFRLVQSLIPEIARKAASIVNEDQPAVSPIISKIANVVFIKENTVQKEDSMEIEAEIINYSGQERDFTLYASPPTGDVPEGGISWNIDHLAPSESRKVSFSMKGKFIDYAGTDYYFKGIDPVYVQGAELLPSDWNVKAVSIEEGDNRDEQ